MKHWHCNGGQQLSIVWLNRTVQVPLPAFLDHCPLWSAKASGWPLDYQCQKFPLQTHVTLPFRLTSKSNALLNSYSKLFFLIYTTYYYLYLMKFWFYNFFLYNYILYLQINESSQGASKQGHLIHISFPFSVHKFLILHSWVLNKFQLSEIISWK